MPARASPRAAASGPDAPGSSSGSGSSSAHHPILGLTHLAVSSPVDAGSDASSSLTPTSAASPVSAMLAGKHKGKARAAAEPERGRRVLPARIRRAAGGGAEGIRDIEEMVVDWLERWGDINTVPPDDLPLQLTTLPYALVTPPIYTVEASAKPLSRASSPTRNGTVPDQSRIETPVWRMVRAGEDDKEEAKEELASGPGQSPTKRLRRGNVGSELIEDVSDQHYALLHRKFEAFERRQRIREREKLQFERYKMRARVDLLRSLPAPQWTSVVSVILARTDAGESWSRGRRKLEAEGVDWLRRKLIKEGVEVLRRYDQLLPNDKKQRLVDDSRVSSPSAPSSLSPPPMSTPDPPPAPRVSALRDEGASSSRRRQRQVTPVKAASPVPIKVEEPDEPPPKPVIRISALALKQTTLAFPKLEKKPAASPRKAVASPRKAAPPPAKIPKIEHVEPADHEPSPVRPPSPRHTRPRFVAPQTASGLPCLIEAAQRREKAIEEAIAANAKVEAAAKAKSEGRVLPGRLIARKKTRESTRITLATPFGLPMPASLETKSEFSISDEEEFWPIIAAREAAATEARRKASTAAPTDEVHAAGAPAGSPSSEALDMEGVEAAVVL